MSRPREAVRQAAAAAAQAIAQGGDPRQAVGQAVGQVAGQFTGQGPGEKGFSLNPGDFLAARDQGVSTGTVIEARSASLNEAGEIVNRSFSERGENGEPVHVISPSSSPRGPPPGWSSR
nr:hypothetical protein GCM10020093_116620 [Planobispora longispora]